MVDRVDCTVLYCRPGESSHLTGRQCGLYALQATATGDSSCATTTVCGETEWEVSPPTLYEDRVCEELTQCSFWEYSKVQPTYSSDRECELLTLCNATNLEYAVVDESLTNDRQCGALSTCEYFDENSFYQTTWGGEGEVKMVWWDNS